MLRLNLLLSVIFCALVSKADVTAVFNWASPNTLSPSYDAPTSANRYGAHISNVEFENNGVLLSINDDKVDDEANKARFVYNTYTAAPELRSNLNSVIEITAPQGLAVCKVIFDGAKVGESYISSAAENSTFSNGTWIAGYATQVADFDVISTINCAKITVVCSQPGGVSDITADDLISSSEEWYTILGDKLNQRPAARGVYIIKNNNTYKKVLIR